MIKILFITICFMVSPVCIAGDVYIFSGAFAYDDGEDGTKQDYDGLTPNGFIGVKYRQVVNNVLFYEVGLKHESSMAYREVGNGFNGVFFQFDFKLF